MTKMYYVSGIANGIHLCLVDVDINMMVINPGRYFDNFIKAKTAAIECAARGVGVCRTDLESAEVSFNKLIHITEESITDDVE